MAEAASPASGKSGFTWLSKSKIVATPPRANTSACKKLWLVLPSAHTLDRDRRGFNCLPGGTANAPEGSRSAFNSGSVVANSVAN